jgi:hypothetical protein
MIGKFLFNNKFHSRYASGLYVPLNSGIMSLILEENHSGYVPHDEVRAGNDGADRRTRCRHHNQCHPIDHQAAGTTPPTVS